jgi:hypothetical protein
MIQRIQTVYLTLTILLSLLFLSGSFFNFTDTSGNLIEAKIDGIFIKANDNTSSLVHNTLPVTVSVLLVTVSSLVTIFLYKSRKIQMRLALSVIVLASIFVATEAYCIWFVTSEYNARFVPGFKMAIPAAMLIFAILAFRGIRKDDRLVKSYDRLR